MRARWTKIVLGSVSLISLIALLLVSGCPAGHDDYPGASCKASSDCYLGEVCTNSVCVPTQDMAINGDFAHPSPDLSGDDMMPMDDMTPVDL